jgi:hypothetical protein
MNGRWFESLLWRLILLLCMDESDKNIIVQ